MSNYKTTNFNLDHSFSCNDWSFDLNENFVNTAIDYNDPITQSKIKSIQEDINLHFEGQHSEFDHIEIACCTNSNLYELDSIVSDDEYLQEDFYVLSFSDSEVVLYLTKS